jgi:hypothetical protein
MVMEQVMTFVRDRIVTVAIQTLVTSLNPAGAFIQAVLAIYNTIMFLVERLRTIGRVLASFVDSIAAIAAGAVGSAAKRVETTMAGLLTLVISFLARLIRLGNVSDAVKRVIDRVRQPIDRALDRVVEWVVATARRLGRFVAQGARGAVQGIQGLLGIRKGFRLANGEAHALYFEQRGSRASVIVASNPVLLRSFVSGIGSRPNLNADKTYALLLIDRIDALEDHTRATNTDHRAEITGLLEELGRTTTALMNKAYRNYIATSPPVYGGLVNTFGRAMRVTLSTNELRQGSRPSVTTPIFNDLNLRRTERGSSYYVLGHLLNERLGGPGNDMRNLTPVSRSGNSLHDQHVERIIKPTQGDIPRAFMYVVTPAYGRTLNATLLARIAAPASPDPAPVQATKARIVRAEQYVPTSLVCSISEVDPLSGRPAGMHETYTIPNDILDRDPSSYLL